MDPPVGLVTSAKAGPGGVRAWTATPPILGLLPVVVSSPPATLAEVAQQSSVIVLALPEDELRAALAALSGALGPGAAMPGRALVSTCPTVSLSLMRSLVGTGPGLFRAIVPPGITPNEVMVALAHEPGTAPELVAAVRAALEAVGTVQLVGEEALDAVAAVALGGPAFLCAALEGMEEAAAAEGLPRATARAFAHQTALATALLLCGHPGSPADLKDQVASPGGTTIVALAALEDAGVRGAYLRAVQRAAAELRQRRDAAASSVLE